MTPFWTGFFLRTSKSESSPLLLQMELEHCPQSKPPLLEQHNNKRFRRSESLSRGYWRPKRYSSEFSNSAEVGLEPPLLDLPKEVPVESVGVPVSELGRGTGGECTQVL